jgi:hypothetical protein
MAMPSQPRVRLCAFAEEIRNERAAAAAASTARLFQTRSSSQTRTFERLARRAPPGVERQNGAAPLPKTWLSEKRAT